MLGTGHGHSHKAWEREREREREREDLETRPGGDRELFFLETWDTRRLWRRRGRSSEVQRAKESLALTGRCLSLLSHTRNSRCTVRYRYRVQSVRSIAVPKYSRTGHVSERAKAGCGALKMRKQTTCSGRGTKLGDEDSGGNRRLGEVGRLGRSWETWEPEGSEMC